ncbi:hypothetical protein [Variovorax sp. J22R115]|uniref:hypothetical protein n=1 Tax=Variovorax sp. J22R115 TaxID=3053509 RepID=UPI002577BD7F|nr:hypothetical protein [Variovorax sp. J22R115]MDM0049291.1 hypothetical protein [Variovorax sp. J22R115]
MRFQNARQPTFALLLAASLFATAVHADDELTAADVADSGKRFSRIGTSYIVDKDNGYLATPKSLFNLWLARFTPRPTIECNTGGDCSSAIPLRAPREFIVEAVVSPDDELKNPKVTCRANSMFCAYRVRFADGEIAYVSVDTFEKSSTQHLAIARDMPGLFSIRPKVATAESRKSQLALEKHFRRIGIKPGFTMADVLRSDWGKPELKTPGNGRAVVWAYQTRMVSFFDGVVHEIKPID